MDIFTATMIAEGDFLAAGIDPEEVTEDMSIEAWQTLIDDGIVWQLQGAFGRTAAALIEAGVCVR